MFEVNITIVQGRIDKHSFKMKVLRKDKTFLRLSDDLIAENRAAIIEVYDGNIGWSDGLKLGANHVDLIIDAVKAVGRQQQRYRADNIIDNALQSLT